MTVGLPTWASRDIIWLAMEGLCRQEASDWELIIYECDSPLLAGFEFFECYWERLKETGCKRLVYMFSAQRLPLGQKWKEIAQMAQGEMLLLQASDQYSHPQRIKKTQRVDWYDTRYFYSYSFISRKLIMFDKNTCDRWLTGDNMAVRTKLLKSLPDNDKRKGVDFHLYKFITGEKVRDQCIYPGLHTNGANTISTSRERHYTKPNPPWKATKKTINDIGLPWDIVDKIEGFTPVKFRDRQGKIRVTFIESVKGIGKGCEREISADAYMALKEFCEPSDGIKKSDFLNELTC